jgi:hypothetical protein
MSGIEELKRRVDTLTPSPRDLTNRNPRTMTDKELIEIVGAERVREILSKGRNL